MGGAAEPKRDRWLNANVRNPASPHWRRWTQAANRCLVPATSFSEYNDKANPTSLQNPDGTPHPMAGKKDVVWFARDRSRPMFSFAGIWTEWGGERGTKSKPIPGPHLIYAFLTCPPNAKVAPVHAKAMPVILTTPEEYDA
jgi:putative SOS response-associated peptidase YedK